MLKKNHVRSLSLGLGFTLLAFSSACQPQKKLQGESAAEGQPTPEAPRAEGPGSTKATLALDSAEQLYAEQYQLPPELRTEAAMRNGAYWAAVSAQRQAQLDAYLQSNRAGVEAFVKNPVSYNGTPALIFRLLPDVLPQLFAPGPFEAATGYFRLDQKDLLPYGFAYTKPPQAAGAQPSPLLVQISCAACHTGRVELPGGKVKLLLGAPSRVADINGYRSALTRAVGDPGFTYEKFAAALASKKEGELYGPERIADEKMDRAIFQAAGETLLKTFKDTLLQRAAYSKQVVGAYTLKNDLRLLQSTPGHIDFGIAVSLALAPPAEVQADPTAALRKYFPPEPGIADIMSVWQQSRRTFAQWDGNLKNKLTRNLGAELGIAGDPRVVNFPNGIATTGFVDKLPAPAYPFKVDMVKAAAGKKIYDQACKSCHESELFMPVDKVGTHPGRAIALTKDTRVLLTAALKAACSDKNNPDCQAPDNEVVVPREDKPGYISLPLDGIWARAPYLHNGSVPTLWHLLVPEERPASFQLSDNSYDEKFVGFGWRLKEESEDQQHQYDRPTQSDIDEGGKAKGQTQRGVVVYDTSIPGLSNQGHADKVLFNGGIDFKREPAKLDALLEYLKTL